jgi:multidrug efflux pump subunit AcrB
MSLMGITFNNLSLLAMSLVAGVLVDDAIVGRPRRTHAHRRCLPGLDRRGEIGLAVLATTMAIVAVFFRSP